MNERSWFPRRAHIIPTPFFLGWVVICIAALVAGPWMLVSALNYRASHQQAEGTVVIDKRAIARGADPAPHVQFEADGKPFDFAVPPPNSQKERKTYREKYQAGKRITVWYPIGEPQAADVEGDHGTLLGGIVFTGVGAFFSLIGGLAFIAEFFPNRFVRFA